MQIGNVLEISFDQKIDSKTCSELNDGSPTDSSTRSFRIGKTSFHLMFSCENISFVLRTHHCSFALQTLRCSVTVTRKQSRSLSLVEMHQQSTIFQKVRMNNRKVRPFLLGVIEGILSTYMFTFTFSIFLRKNLSFM